MRCWLTTLVCIVFASPVSAVVRRDDESDNQYVARGTQYPAAVWINSDTGFGSGTLIAPDWILTAAHVLHDDSGNLLPTIDWPDVEIGNGSSYGLGLFTTAGVGIRNIEIPNGWGGPNSRDGRDVALIQLDSPVTVTPMFRNNGSVNSLLGQNVTIVGYGLTGDGTMGARTRDDNKRGQDNVIDVRGPTENASFSNDIILIDFDCPAGTCNEYGSATPRSFEGSTAPGDSGGPWIAGGTIAAVTSFGQFRWVDTNEDGTMTDDEKIHGFYGFYNGATAVSPHNDWINSAMGGVNWNLRGRANFDNENAWGDGLVPFGEDVQFSLPTDLSVDIPEIVVSSNRSVRNIQVEFGPHLFDIGNNDILTATDSVVVNDGGTMTVRDGTLEVMNRITVGSTSTTSFFRMLSGKVIARNPTGNSLYIGTSGRGQFDHEGGELVVDTNASLAVSPGSHGTYNFSRGIATFEESLYVGDGGTGIVNHFDRPNANLTVTDDLYLGSSSGSSGDYIRSAGNLTVGHNLLVGYNGNGWFEQSEGNTIVHDEISVGRFSGSDSTLWMNGGVLQCGGDFVAGYEGKGVVNITGGTVNVGDEVGDDLFIAIENNSSNAVNQSGDSTVRVFGNVRIAQGSSSFGTYQLAGGRLDVRDGQIFLGTGGAFEFNAGTLHVRKYNGDLTNGDDDFGNGISVLAPRNSNGINEVTGITEVTGNYTQRSDATLQIEIGGRVHGTGYDRLTVGSPGSSMNLAGTLEVSLVPGFVPLIGDEFDILNWQILSGTFDSVLLQPLGPSLRWDDSSLYTSGRLFVVAAPPGDFNEDDAIDAADYVVWRKMNRSQQEYDDWRENFGMGGAGGSARFDNDSGQSTVPEPQGMFLVAVTACLSNTLRRRRNTASAQWCS